MFKYFYFPPQLIEGANKIFSSLFFWEKVMLGFIFFSSLALFILFCIFPERIKKLRIICGAVAFFLFFSTFWLFLSFSYGNSFGWMEGGLLFLTLTIFIPSAIFTGMVILPLCLGVVKLRDWKLWGCLAIGLTLTSTTIVVLANFLEKI
jgi:hypothetical protein